MPHAADKGKFYKQPTVRIEWLRQVQAKTYCGRRPPGHPSRKQQPLDPIDLHVAMRLLDHLNRETGQLDPAHETIAAALGTSVATVWRSLDRLAEYKFLKATERFGKGGLQTSNQYDLNLELAGHDVTSSVKHPVRRRRRTRSFIGDVPGTSSVNDEPQRKNPGEKNPSFPPRSDERGQTGSGSGKDRPSGGPALDLNRIDFTDCVLELEKLLPAYNPFGGYEDKPVNLKRSRRGAIQRMKELHRLGFTIDEIREFVEAYRRNYDEEKEAGFWKASDKCGKMLSGLLLRLLEQCAPYRDNAAGTIYGWQVPERLLCKKSDYPQLKAAGMVHSEPPEDDEECWNFSPDDIARHTAPPEDDQPPEGTWHYDETGNPYRIEPYDIDASL